MSKNLEDENISLKKQLRNKNKELKEWKSKYFNLLNKYKAVTGSRKPRYRNKGKKRV